MPVKIITLTLGMAILVLTMLILPGSIAAPGEEIVPAYNQHNLYYEWDYPDKLH